MTKSERIFVKLHYNVQNLQRMAGIDLLVVTGTIYEYKREVNMVLILILWQIFNQNQNSELYHTCLSCSRSDLCNLIKMY